MLEVSARTFAKVNVRTLSGSVRDKALEPLIGSFLYAVSDALCQENEWSHSRFGP
ncbi:hypothetical protein ALQ50_03079 [Pseudomonas coronafaciens pv. coronafaciens]|nr:hypothetical protein ALQ50_03079 [Pseudomonas coronafaciens pv. coronafaciens]